MKKYNLIRFAFGDINIILFILPMLFDPPENFRGYKGKASERLNPSTPFNLDNHRESQGEMRLNAQRFKLIPIFLLGFLLFQPFFTQANLWFNSNCQNAYEKMIRLDFEGARAHLKVDKGQNPRNAVATYIHVYSDFIRIALSESRDEYDLYHRKASRLIDELESEEKDSPYRLYFKADLHMQKAMLFALDKSYLSAMNHMRKSSAAIKENIRKFPQFVPNFKIMGLLHIVLGSIPEDYDWVLGIVGMKGDVNKGLDQLNTLANSTNKSGKYHWLQTEAYLLWTFTTLNYDNENKELTAGEKARIQEINSLAASNPFLCYALTNFYRNQGDNEKAIEVLKSLSYKKGQQALYYLDYMLGETHLYKMDKKSISYFETYLQRFPGNYYRKAALQRMAWYYLISNDMEKYQHYINRVKEEGATFLDGDKKADKAAKSDEIPNAYLLKCRLLFDGGYYAEAARVFQVHSPMIVLKTPRDKVEYPYRMARIYDQWGKQDLAIRFYTKTIDLGKDESWYFAANAALHLGQIYEKEGNKEKAKSMYEACKNMDFDEYRNSITQKAKAGLSRLEE